MKVVTQLLWFVLAVGAILVVISMWEFSVAASYEEFIDLPGPVAFTRWNNLIGSDDEWPPEISPDSLEQVSARRYYGVDESSVWMKVRLSNELARNWAEHLRRNQKLRLVPEDGCHQVQGIERTIKRSQLPDFLMSDAPEWWEPSSLQFEATEVMRWHNHYATGCYSAYDIKRSTFWICEFSQQHAELWSRNAAPSGKRFGSAR